MVDLVRKNATSTAAGEIPAGVYNATTGAWTIGTLGGIQTINGHLAVKGDGTTDSYVSLYEGSIERWRIQGSGATNGLDFIYQAGGITAGGIGPSGAWTVGPATAATGAAVTHTVRGIMTITYSNGATGLAIINNDNGAGDAHLFDLQAAAVSSVSGGTAFRIRTGGTASTIISASYQGAWTFGSTTSASNTHIFQSSGTTTVRVSSLAGGSANLDFFRNSATTWQVGVDDSGLSGSGGFYWYAGGAYRGGIDTNGAWTLGPSGYQGNHSVNAGGFHVFKSGNLANASTVLLQAADASGTLGIIGGYKNASNTGSSGFIMCRGTLGTTFYMYIGENTGTWYTSSTSTDIGRQLGTVVGSQTSDIRLKSNVESLKYGLKEICQIEPISFEMHGQKQIGFSAQQVRSVLPEVVYDTKEQIDDSGNTKLAMYYAHINAALVNAVKELKAELDAVKASIKR